MTVGYPDVLVNSISPDRRVQSTGQSLQVMRKANSAGRKSLNAASAYGEDALGLDESDNIFIAQSRYFSTNNQPNGGNHSRQYNQITKLDSTGNHIWSRVFAKKIMAQEMYQMNIYIAHTLQKEVRFILLELRMGRDSFNAGGSKLYKIDGSIDNYTSPMLDAEAGFDYFKLI